MNDLDRDDLRARLRAGDPYQGESMAAPDSARIQARMRAVAANARVGPNWIPAVAAAALVTVVALGIWAGSRPSTTVETLPAPATQGSAAVAELPADPVATPELPPVRESQRTGPAAVQSAPAPLASAESRRLADAEPQTAAAENAAQGETIVAAADAPRTEARRIQFTARRGTRIVWTLDPDFDPTTTRNDAPPVRHQQGANDKW